MLCSWLCYLCCRLYFFSFSFPVILSNRNNVWHPSLVLSSAFLEMCSFRKYSYPLPRATEILSGWGAKEAVSEGVGLGFVVNVLCFYLEVIVRGKSRTEYPYKRPSYAATQKHAFSTPLGRDYSKHLLLVLLPSFRHVTFIFFIFTLVLFFDQIFFFSSF